MEQNFSFMNEGHTCGTERCNSIIRSHGIKWDHPEVRPVTSLHFQHLKRTVCTKTPAAQVSGVTSVDCLQTFPLAGGGEGGGEIQKKPAAICGGLSEDGFPPRFHALGLH